MIRVTAKKDSFRRAGLAFSREPRDFADGELDEATLELLEMEPMLAVTEVGDGEPGAGEPVKTETRRRKKK